MTKQPKEQSIESLKYAAKVTNYRWAIAMTALVTLVVGVILGYFMSITVINDTQSKVVNSIELTAVSKAEQ